MVTIAMNRTEMTPAHASAAQAGVIAATRRRGVLAGTFILPVRTASPAGFADAGVPRPSRPPV